MIYVAKRFAFIALLFLLAFTLSVTALATLTEEEIFAEDNVEDPPVAYDSNLDVTYDVEEAVMPETPSIDLIITQWEMEGYPDDIGGKYYDSGFGTYGVLVVNPSAKRIKELHELFEAHGIDVIITPCKYSYNELRQVQNEITEMMISNPDSGIYGTGTGWSSENRGVQGFGDSGKEFRVVIDVDESVFDHYRVGFANRYGDRVHVVVGLPFFRLSSSTDDGVVSEGSNATNTAITIIPIEITGKFDSAGYYSAGGNGNLILWIITAIVLLFTLACLIRFRPLPALSKQTVNGNTVTEATTLTKKHLITAIKNSATEPGEELFGKIMKRVENA